MNEFYPKLALIGEGLSDLTANQSDKNIPVLSQSIYLRGPGLNREHKEPKGKEGYRNDLLNSNFIEIPISGRDNLMAEHIILHHIEGWNCIPM